MNAKLQGGRNDRTREICFIIGYCTYTKLKQLEDEKCNECNSMYKLREKVLWQGQ